MFVRAVSSSEEDEDEPSSQQSEVKEEGIEISNGMLFSPKTDIMSPKGSELMSPKDDSQQCSAREQESNRPMALSRNVQKFDQFDSQISSVEESFEDLVQVEQMNQLNKEKNQQTRLSALQRQMSTIRRQDKVEPVNNDNDDKNGQKLDAGENVEEVVDTAAEDMILLGIKAPKFVKNRKRCILYPDDTFYIYWDMFISLILLVSCMITPLNFAFQVELESIQWYVNCGIIIDLFFALEIVINFNSSYVDDVNEIIDNRKAIFRAYFYGWFPVDVISILPLEIILLAIASNASQETDSGDAQMNGMIRMSKFSKLYKLVKITRLIRLFKLMKFKEKSDKEKKKKKKNSETQMSQLGPAFERLSFFCAILFIMSHIFGCIWIFVGRSQADNTEEEGQSWIISNGFEDLKASNLYLTGLYFTFTTISTVGYGDISGGCFVERVICIFYLYVGVLTYGFISGSITSIIINYEEMGSKNLQQHKILNKMLKENEINNDLFYEIKTVLERNEDQYKQEDLLEFLDDLPIRLKIKTVMYVYKEAYNTIQFLKDGTENFLSWICPNLEQNYYTSDQIVYYESDKIGELFFQLNGFSGFVIPFEQNVVYIQIENGDMFGDIDFIASAKEKGIDIKEIINKMFDKGTSFVRYFTVVCIKESCLMSINIQNLHKMSKLHNLEFMGLFKNSQSSLNRALKQKLLLTQNISNKKMMVTASKFYRQNYESQFEVLNKELEFDEINCLYYKGCKTLKFINDKKQGDIFRDFEITRSFESFCTDESMYSWYTDKEEEFPKLKPSEPKKVQVEDVKAKSFSESFMQNTMMMSIIATKMKIEKEKEVVVVPAFDEEKKNALQEALQANVKAQLTKVNQGLNLNDSDSREEQSSDENSSPLQLNEVWNFPMKNQATQNSQSKSNKTPNTDERGKISSKLRSRDKNLAIQEVGKPSQEFSTRQKPGLKRKSTQESKRRDKKYGNLFTQVQTMESRINNIQENQTQYQESVDKILAKFDQLSEILQK